MTRGQVNIIKDALEYPGNLSSWEVSFIDSLADKDRDYKLSDKQAEVLSSIEDKL